MRSDCIWRWYGFCMADVRFSQNVIKALDTDKLLKADKRDPKVENLYYVDEVHTLASSKGATNMYDLNEKLKGENK